MFAQLGSIFRLLPIEQVGVIAHFAQLNQNILEVGDRVTLVDLVLLQERAIDPLLLLRDADRNMDFNFGLELLFDFALDPAQ